MLIYEWKYIYTCTSYQWSVKCDRAWETAEVNLVLFTIRRRRTALFKKSIARRSSFDFERLMLLHVNSGYNRMAWGQLFLMYKIERSPLPLSFAESGYSISKRERRKTIGEDPTITAFPRRGILNRRRTKPFLPFFLFRLSYLALSSSSTCRALSLLLIRVKKRASLAPGPVFSGGEQFERQFVRS